MSVSSFLINSATGCSRSGAVLGWDMRRGHGVFDADAVIAKLDALIAAQLDLICSHPKLAELRRAWHALWLLLADRVPGDGVEVAVLPIAEGEVWPSPRLGVVVHRLLLDPHVAAGGVPYGVVVYERDVSDYDEPWLVELVRACARAQAPVLVGCGPWLRGAHHDDGRAFAPPAIAHLRSREEGRYLGMCGPRVTDEAGVELRACAVVACAIARSFARYRWGVNFTGSHGGRIPNVALAHPVAENADELRFCRLAEDEAGVYVDTAYSTYRAAHFGDAEDEQDAALNHSLDRQLPYLFVLTRFAHYARLVYRDERLAGTEHMAAAEAAAVWIQSHVADASVGDEASRRRRPVRKAEITTWGTGFLLRLRPMFKVRGMFFTLRCEGTWWTTSEGFELPSTD